MTFQDSILLSVVVTSRNDDHGKNLLYRMQQFINGFVEQCKSHNLRAELIIVEWNPPDDTPPLSQALFFPEDKGSCTIRIIQVPKEVHVKLEHADKIPLFQMIGKNVGIRRAAGQFILATNIDILFSTPLIQYLKTQLKMNRLYRVDRLDVPEKLLDSCCLEEVLRFCSNNVIRINKKTGTFFVDRSSIFAKTKNKIKKHKQKVKNGFLLITNSLTVLKKIVIVIFIKKDKQKVKNGFLSIAKSLNILKKSVIVLFIKAAKTFLLLCEFFSKKSYFSHTNACGDFTLLSSQDWSTLKGYPEWNIHSWHMDSVLIFQARQHGIQEIDLPRRMSIYHIEHEAGSGFSPENAHLLFNRLNQKGIPYLNDSALHQLSSQMKNSREKVIYNDENWGMAELSLEEFTV
jgi:hypothetical protein